MKKFLLFTADEELYASELIEAKEIHRIKSLNIKRIPKAKNYVEGLINLRGKPIPIINLNKKLEKNKNQDYSKNRVIIFQKQNCFLGVLADSIIGIKSKEKKSIQNFLVNQPAYIKGKFDINNKEVKIIDLDAIMSINN